MVTIEDRSRWRYDVNGAPLRTAEAFRNWVDGLPASLDAGSTLTTETAWPIFRRQAFEGTLSRIRPELFHMSSKVRYPAEGMAYVLCPVLHPDQDEIVVFDASEIVSISTLVFTLVLERGEWRIFALGLDTPVPPADVGKTAYSW